MQPGNNEVEAQLGRILASDEFLSSQRLSALLRYLVTEILAGRTEQLQAYAIALEVFDRPSDFYPQSNAVVRVQAGQLRLRLGRYYAIEGKNDSVRISVPKGEYVPDFNDSVLSDPNRVKSDPPPEKRRLPSVLVCPFANFTDSSKFDFFSVGLTGDVIAALACCHVKSAIIASSGPCG